MHRSGVCPSVCPIFFLGARRILNVTHQGAARDAASRVHFRASVRRMDIQNILVKLDTNSLNILAVHFAVDL